MLLWAILWLLMSWTMILCNCCAMQKATMWQFQPLDAEMFILNLQQYVSSANKRSWEDDCSLIAHQLGHNHSQVRWHILLITYIDRFCSIYINIKLICFITCTHAGTCSANNRLNQQTVVFLFLHMQQCWQVVGTQARSGLSRMQWESIYTNGSGVECFLPSQVRERKQ